MKHFAAFEGQKTLLPPFSLENPDLHECAKIIQKSVLCPFVTRFCVP
jgi:hypothetical protein